MMETDGLLRRRAANLDDSQIRIQAEQFRAEHSMDGHDKIYIAIDGWKNCVRRDEWLQLLKEGYEEFREHNGEPGYNRQMKSVTVRLNGIKEGNPNIRYLYN